MSSIKKKTDLLAKALADGIVFKCLADKHSKIPHRKYRKYELKFSKGIQKSKIQNWKNFARPCVNWIKGCKVEPITIKGSKRVRKEDTECEIL